MTPVEILTGVGSNAIPVLDKILAFLFLYELRLLFIPVSVTTETEIHRYSLLKGRV
jgi:hypothetical protein